jgi:malate dehydrogenase (oxaloacetate-decarboxylating)
VAHHATPHGGAGAGHMLPAMSATPSAQYSITIRVEIAHRPGMLGQVAGAIGRAGGVIGAVDLVEVTSDRLLRDITIDAAGPEQWEAIVAALGAVEGVRVVDTTDRTFLLHVGGKIEQHNKHALRTRDDLSMAYTPGVARVCLAIAADPDKAFQYTIKRNTVAVVSDGTAVLGLGDIGPEAALPVMEGKAMLFKEFAGVDAFPICLSTKDTDEIVEAVARIAPTFGGINLEDISAPRCFEIEDRLKAELDIPVFHDDQHGTAVVTLAAIINACKVTGRELADLRVLVTGLGAAGVAVTKILMEAGVTHIVGADSRGLVSTTREDYLDGSMNAIKRWYAEHTNPDRLRCPYQCSRRPRATIFSRRLGDRLIVVARTNHRLPSLQCNSARPSSHQASSATSGTGWGATWAPRLSARTRAAASLSSRTGFIDRTTTCGRPAATTVRLQVVDLPPAGLVWV